MEAQGRARFQPVPFRAPRRLQLRGSEVLPKDLKKEFKELALADAAPQIFKCLAVLKYVFNRRFIRNPLMCGFMELPSGDVSELLKHPRTFKSPSC